MLASQQFSCSNYTSCRNKDVERSDKIKNEDIRAKIRVVSIVGKTREARLRWFGHVKRRCVDALVRKC